MSEMKNSLNGHNNRMELSGERDDKRKDRTYLRNREKRYWKLKKCKLRYL